MVSVVDDVVAEASLLGRQLHARSVALKRHQSVTRSQAPCVTSYVATCSAHDLVTFRRFMPQSLCMFCRHTCRPWDTGQGVDGITCPVRS